MFQRFQVFFIALLLGLASCTPTQAQDAWVKIGSNTFDTAADIAGIALDGTMGGSAIRLEAKQGSVKLRAVVVTYGQGRVHVEERPIVLNAGERTRSITLSAKDEIVRGLEIVLAPGGKGKVTLEVWALRSTPPVAASPAGEHDGVSLGKPVGKTEPIGAPSPTPGDDEARRAAELEAKQKAEADARRAAADSERRQADARRTSEDLQRRALDDDAKRMAEAEVARREEEARRHAGEKAEDRSGGAAAKTEPERNSPFIIIPGIRIGKSLGKAGTQRRSSGGGHVSGMRVDQTAAKPKSASPKSGETAPAAPATRGLAPDAVSRTSYSYSLETLDACVKAKTCTPVPVFFGTDRDQTEAQGRVSFGVKRAGRVQLGRVVVTVPSKNRQKGEINLPGTMDWLKGAPETGDPKRHFTIPKSGVTLYRGESEFIAAVKEHVTSGLGTFKDHAFVYVHGYRVPWEFAAMRTAQIAYDLSPDDAPFGTPFLYSWPSQGAAAEYLTDFDNARRAVRHLVDYLRLVVEKTGASQVHVIAHSMGNFPVMHALAEIARTAPSVKFSQVILAAPDVEKDEFEELALGVVKTARSVTLYASASDIALLVSRLVRRDKPRAGDAKDPPGPAIVAGMDTVDISRLSTGFMSYLSWNHDKYADSPVLLNDISTLFRDGHRAPNLRNLSFRMYQARFWQYQQ